MKQSRAGWWIGGILVGVGVVAGILWFVLSLARISDNIERFPRVAAGSSQTLRLEARKYVIYVEGPNADETSLRFDVTITGENGTTVPLSPYNGSLTYSLAGHEGSAGATVTPPRAGPYRVSVSRAIGARGKGIALGESVGNDILWTLVGAFGIGGLFSVTGTVILAVTSVRQYNARRAAGQIPPD